MIGQSGTISSKKPFEIQEPEFRWNAWTAIALGSKGYQYFCYWTPYPDPEDKWFDDQYMINSVTGEPTPRYYFGQRLNLDIQHFKVLMHCHADGAIMNPLSEYALYQPRSKYSKLMSVSGDRSVVGCFRDVDDAAAFKAVVTHLEPSRDGVVDSFTVTLTFDSSITTVTTTYSKDGTVANVPVADGKVTLTFDEGEAYLVEWSE
jgi:hypothetical protein